VDALLGVVAENVLRPPDRGPEVWTELFTAGGGETGSEIETMAAPGSGRGADSQRGQPTVPLGEGTQGEAASVTAPQVPAATAIDVAGALVVGFTTEKTLLRRPRHRGVVPDDQDG
jgi:hypothetical protein